MPILTARHLCKSFGVHTLLDDAELHVARGDKVGLVGRNGAGKSTLMRLLAGVEPADAGELTFRSGTHVAWLPQEPDVTGCRTVLDVALMGARQARGLREPHEQQVAAEQALGHLGVRDHGLAVAAASGGTLRRAALAGVLVQEADLLLLDEPTNHLDVDAAAWLEQRLRQFPGAVVMVTHDRWLLNQVASRIVEVRRGRLHSYDGTLQDWLETRLEEDAQSAREEQNRRNLLKAELDWLGRSPAARSTKPKARLVKAQTAAAATGWQAEPVVQLPKLPSDRLGRTVLEAHALSAGHGAALVRGLDLALRPGDRVGIVGPNGAGKTTLLRTLLGDLPPLTGRVQHGLNTRPVWLDQGRSGLDPTASVRQVATPAGGEYVTIGDEKLHVATWLGMFLFRGGDLQQPVATLSGGQKMRLLLARRLQEPMNLFALDEPTNDLDFETLEVLEQALAQYPGCVLTVSHDRAFLDRVCTHLLEVPGDGTATLHVGGWSALQARKSAAANTPAAVVRESKAAPVPVSSSETAPPKLTMAEDKRLAGIELEVEAVEQQVATAEARLGDPEVLADVNALRQATDALAAACTRRDEVWQAWQVLEAKRDAWQAWLARKKPS
jgi:ATP-binding cassette subfamily F protein uup